MAQSLVSGGGNDLRLATSLYIHFDISTDGTSMPRRTRKKIVGKAETHELDSRTEELLVLERILHRAWQWRGYRAEPELAGYPTHRNSQNVNLQEAG